MATLATPVSLGSDSLPTRHLASPPPDDRPEPLYLGRAMRETRKVVARLAQKDLTVVLLGETGTGKGLVARDVHELSLRASGPFCVLNCAAIPASLTEATLFGHERGAFTGADRARPGVFEQAAGGTIFLDEVGELSATAQTALLRVLEARRLTRLGSDTEIAVDVRVVAATHRDLNAMTRRGAFRQDLLHRLFVATVHLPPLRERREEIAPLARHFLTKEGAGWDIEPAALARLQEYDWPGNVRELQNVILRGTALASGPTLVETHLGLPSRALREPGEQAPAPSSFRERMDSLLRTEIQNALERTAGNQRRAAGLLGMPLRTFERHVRRLREDAMERRTCGP